MKTIIIQIVTNNTGDIFDKGSYRPISLAKVQNSMLDSIIQKYLKLHDTQFGFRPGLKTESTNLALNYTVYTNRRTPVYEYFFDLSKTFDLVSYAMLWG